MHAVLKKSVLKYRDIPMPAAFFPTPCISSPSSKWLTSIGLFVGTTRPHARCQAVIVFTLTVPRYGYPLVRRAGGTSPSNDKASHCTSSTTRKAPVTGLFTSENVVRHRLNAAAVSRSLACCPGGACWRLNHAHVRSSSK